MVKLPDLKARAGKIKTADGNSVDGTRNKK